MDIFSNTIGKDNTIETIMNLNVCICEFVFNLEHIFRTTENKISYSIDIPPISFLLFKTQYTVPIFRLPFIIGH